MAAMFPVGFRFRPTEEELVRSYLYPKVTGTQTQGVVGLNLADLLDDTAI